METKEMLLATVIPSFEPDHRLTPYIKSLCDSGFQVIVVDDGSGEKYRSIFDLAALIPGCTVLHHAINKGKGCALKTAYRYLSDERPEIDGIITADADGQHTLKDVRRLEKALKDGLQGLILGTRDFTLEHVPKKSRMGNQITSYVFWLLYGVWCPDTQTGLRAFHASLLPLMQEVKGERFEYEMNVLITLAHRKIPMPPVTIETVYENDNVGSHFHPIRDSIRIYKVILGNFFKFIFTSLIGTGIDMVIYYVLFDVLENAALQPAWLRIATAKTIARLVSAGSNFLLNKHYVFMLKSKGQHAGLKYAVLSIMVLATSVGLISLLEYVFKIDERILSPIIDLILFFISYRVQRKWVFEEDNNEK